MNFESLKTTGFQEKLKEVETPEELLAIVKEQGLELGDAQLEAVTGGDSWYECSDDRSCSDVMP